ncbi:MAG TPA: DUF296 domain-containing protein [Thermodesulfovibrionales bacterium]|nr:DUF296 domain-containing protein [Thermodesulfovibrionales bacterium]
MILREFTAGRIYQGSLVKGKEIIDGLTEVMKRHDITAGTISGLGAVSEAQIGYFNAHTKSYEKIIFHENMEIVSLRGNISFKDNEVFPHLHVVFSRRDFSTVGGHLFAGSKVYAFEFEIVSLEGKTFTRGFDEDTGLFLWKG